MSAERSTLGRGTNGGVTRASDRHGGPGEASGREGGLPASGNWEGGYTDRSGQRWVHVAHEGWRKAAWGSTSRRVKTNRIDRALLRVLARLTDRRSR